MGALETAKEIGRMTATATLGKDVIDLLKEKVALLTEQVGTLDSENKNLKSKVYDLEQELAKVQPKENELHEEAVKLLKLLTEYRALGIYELSNGAGITEVKAEYHRDVLFKAQMIGYAGGISFGDATEEYTLLPKGREYLAKRGLI